MLKQKLSKMTRTQKLRQPEYYMMKLGITLEEALELMDFDKNDAKANKKYINKESKQRIQIKKEETKAKDRFKAKAREIARKVALKKETNVKFDNGTIRMDVEKELNEKVPHQTITAELNAMVKENILKKVKEGNKNMYQRIEE